MHVVCHIAKWEKTKCNKLSNLAGALVPTYHTEAKYHSLLEIHCLVLQKVVSGEYKHCYNKTKI